LIQLSSILSVSNNQTINKSSGILAIKTEGKFIIADAIGEYFEYIDKNIVDVLTSEELNCLDITIKENKTVYLSNSFISHFTSQYDSEYIVFIKFGVELNKWDKNLLDIFCTNISIILDNILLNSEIEMSQKEIIFTLGEISEARSKETGCHVKRVAEYTKLLALKYGLSLELAEKIRLASPMHDIGKLAIPDNILNKPGKLTPEEFEIIKTHSTIGYEMLKNSNRDIIKIGAIIALHHHEKYNGTGYPAGLKGEDIHIYGRISAITDVFDALGSNRVYKKAWDLDKIIAYFNEERGQHFDPFLLDLFLDNLDEFLKIRDMFPDEKK
jgi:response regulator RpfG family c-di-GMP phosphodiesterase